MLNFGCRTEKNSLIVSLHFLMSSLTSISLMSVNDPISILPDIQSVQVAPSKYLHSFLLVSTLNITVQQPSGKERRTLFSLFFNGSRDILWQKKLIQDLFLLIPFFHSKTFLWVFDVFPQSYLIEMVTFLKQGFLFASLCNFFPISCRLGKVQPGKKLWSAGQTVDSAASFVMCSGKLLERSCKSYPFVNDVDKSLLFSWVVLLISFFGLCDH